MNLHLTHDNVFIDYIINSAADLNLPDNKYVIYTENTSPPKLVKSSKIEFAKYDSSEFWAIIGDIKQYQTIYIHWLYGRTVDFVNKLPDSVKVVWCFWGGDGLELPGMFKNIYQPVTYKYFLGRRRFRVFPVSLKKYRLDFYLFRTERKFRADHLKAIKRVDYFAHYLEADYKLIKKHTGFNAEYIPFHYASLERFVPVGQVKKRDGYNLILGNSDSMPNNHFEAIDQLALNDLGDKKIFCPLSYEKGKYADDVASYGNAKLKENFVALLDFLPKEEYDQMLESVSFAIMNHNRSQALGNILVLLWNGAKLFMSVESPLYRFFRENNLIVFPFQSSFIKENKSLYSALSDEQIRSNQTILLEMFGEKNYLKKIKRLLTI